MNFLITNSCIMIFYKVIILFILKNSLKSLWTWPYFWVTSLILPNKKPSLARAIPQRMLRSSAMHDTCLGRARFIIVIISIYRDSREVVQRERERAIVIIIYIYICIYRERDIDIGPCGERLPLHDVPMAHFTANLSNVGARALARG